MMVRNYRDLKVWEKAMDLVERIYGITRKFPDSERFGLISQMQRSAVSVPSNIAEGHARDSTRDYLRYLSIAYGSLAELETQTMIASRLSYISDDQAKELLDAEAEIGRMLSGLKKSLKQYLSSPLAPNP